MEHTNLRRGFSLIELLIVIAIILVIAAIAVPNAQKQLMASREAAAIGHIKTIQQAQVQFYTQFGHYAASLAELGPPASGVAGLASADLIPRSLAEGKKSGYLFSIQYTADGYSISALPEIFGSSGRRTFYSDQTLVIRESWSAERANAASPAIGP